MSEEVTIVIGIGGNVRGEAMSFDRFAAFQQETLGACNILGAVVYFHGVGEGVFEGKPEKSYTIVASLPTDRIHTLRVLLRALATEYEQQSIALTQGHTSFVEALRPGVVRTTGA